MFCLTIFFLILWDCVIYSELFTMFYLTVFCMRFCETLLFTVSYLQCFIWRFFFCMRFCEIVLFTVNYLQCFIWRFFFFCGFVRLFYLHYVQWDLVSLTIFTLVYLILWDCFIYKETEFIWLFFVVWCVRYVRLCIYN